MSLTLRELSTILAALRHWQRTTTPNVRQHNPIASDPSGQHHSPLSDTEIDTLCERLNLDTPSRPTNLQPPANDLLPDDFHLALGDATLADAEVHAPYPLVRFARSMHDRPGSPTIALLYENEAILYVEEELEDDRHNLITQGWPPRFIDFLIQSTKDGYNYIRLI